MDEKQLNYEFMSILSESHPGLTFEEYRDSCVFLLFYQYLCLRYDEKLEEQYKLNAMVRLAIRGKLQMPAFLRFMESASPFIHMVCGRFQLTDFSFYKSLVRIQSLEKQKSYARFFRKLIKKMDAWDCDELLLERYAGLFEKLLAEFAKMKKETYLSDSLVHLYQMFFSDSLSAKRFFVPDFQYGILFHTMQAQGDQAEVYGYEKNPVYVEMMDMLFFMKGFPEESLHFYSKEEWENQGDFSETFDCIGVFMPEGVEPGTMISKKSGVHSSAELLQLKSKGEFPFLFSALPILGENGGMAVVLPSALLYREGKETQIRKYMVEQLNCLDAVMLLPDHVFQSAGQTEVLLFIKKNRKETNVMFFDCSEVESFEGEQLDEIELAWKERKTIPGFCSSVERKTMEQNEYNLNLPRYIVRGAQKVKVDLEERRRRIAEIDKELEEIEKRIAMYRRDLEL